MEIIKVQNTEEDFQGFLKLEEEFNRYYEKLGIGDQYGRVLFEDQPLSDHKAEFADYLKEGSFFYFAKDGNEYAGYISGVIEKMPRGYKTEKVGYLDSVIVSEKYRNQGTGKTMMGDFFDWLKKQNISICQLDVKAKNIDAVEMYKKMGFEIDEHRMWKRI